MYGNSMRIIKRIRKVGTQSLRRGGATVSTMNNFQTCCLKHGSPMNIIGKSHRFLYAAAWGSIAFLATDLILGFVEIVELSGPPYVTVFNKVLSMIIIGVDYFPMFAALALESVTGYMIGTAYAWMLLIVQIFTEAECELAAQARLVLFFRDLPNLICLGYLSVSLPVRAIWALRKTSIGLISSSERVSVLKLTKKAEFSSEAKHVKRLLKPLPPPTEPPSTCNDKLIVMLKTFVSDWIYQSKHGFKYSARMLSIMVIGLMLIYKVTLEVTVVIVSFLKLIQDSLQKELAEIGWSAKANETQDTSDLRQRIYLFYNILIDVKKNVKKNSLQKSKGLEEVY
ncbi:receptor for retinol uptake stra6-like [Mercenaria mercenaria]|uniref:receptor for retinol uptake stra6-like n=1 Tax=Mercenaria mercenaria TaxID=6596 RepID=UPI00234F9131|nr:receptor for retinol uptake stra6-like [Mercenaria mercenaria]